MKEWKCDWNYIQQMLMQIRIEKAKKRKEELDCFKNYI